ncbi:uncharacterized protein LOC125216728 [Salvia hispanica]|uniref:uncharacterized protein LOC125216728 n=1 Tax=Salvia hispanica TaxID=49212 RepID=UPI0020094D5D|nr:uncharacterized protein LOC125216728 [Salvia hispanica]
MGEMASLWSYAEHGEMDQLGQKLLYTSLELEKLKSEAMEEMGKNKEYVNQLIQLLQFAIDERDEARKQLDDLISAGTEMFYGGAESPLLNPAAAKANSSITESNSFSETHNYQSPVESFFDAAVSPPPPISDRAALVVESLAQGRVLPRKGMLLQAVLQAGPLLQTLMVAGPLPRWRNPPRMRPFQVPAVGEFGPRQQMMGSNLGDFGFGNNASLISVSSNSGGCFRLPKRQRFC